MKELNIKKDNVFFDKTEKDLLKYTGKMFFSYNLGTMIYIFESFNRGIRKLTNDQLDGLAQIGK